MKCSQIAPTPYYPHYYTVIATEWIAVRQDPPQSFICWNLIPKMMVRGEVLGGEWVMRVEPSGMAHMGLVLLQETPKTSLAP